MTTLLDQLDPAAALPASRRLARTAPDPDDRITAIRILDEYGNRDTDPTLLGSISDGDDADGDPKAQQLAEKWGWDRRFAG